MIHFVYADEVFLFGWSVLSRFDIKYCFNLIQFVNYSLII